MKIFFRRIIARTLVLNLFLFMLALSLLSMPSCKSSLPRFEESREKMGTYVNIIIYTNDWNPRKIIDDGFDVIDKQSKISSNYDPESAVSILNKQGFIDNYPGELGEIIKLSIDYNEITNGAFDITIDPVLTLWSEGLWQENTEVQNEAVKEALKLIGPDKIKITDSRIELTAKGSSVTLGGAAKGYIVDKVLESLKSAGIKNALVNAGGDMAAAGSKPDGSLWTAGLENPDNNMEKIADFAFSNMAIATSGNYYRYFDPKKEVHHIIDPRTGFSANECISATVIAKNAVLADILATSVFVLGPNDGIELINSLENTEALIIGADRLIYKSSGLDKYLLK